MELFIRNGRNLELTDAGMALLPLAREAVALSIRMDEMMVSLKGSIYGHLIVCCSTTPGKYVLPNLLARFHRTHPQVRVTCQVTSQTDALRSVVEGEAHFALFSVDHSQYADIEAIAFICDPIVLIAPLDHPWAKCEEIEPGELLEGEYIMRESTSGTFNAVREALTRQDVAIDKLQVVLTLGNAEAIALAVQEGIGVGFVSRMVVDRLCKGKVAEVRVHGMDICREIYVGHNSRRPATNAQTAFWNFLTAGERVTENVEQPV
jgi:DNA-binding transcriptional LysR family regulator